jgi:hypothetical protein
MRYAEMRKYERKGRDRLRLESRRGNWDFQPSPSAIEELSRLLDRSTTGSRPR